MQHATCRRDADFAVIGVVGVGHDISELKKAIPFLSLLKSILGFDPAYQLCRSTCSGVIRVIQHIRVIRVIRVMQAIRLLG